MHQCMIVGLCGFAGAGKGEVAAYLKTKGWAHRSIAQMLREELTKHGIEINRDTMILMANTLRAGEGCGVLVSRIMKRLPEGNVVIESIRHPDEVTVLRQHPGALLLAIDAPPAIRLKRLVHRHRPGDPMTAAELKALDDRENDPSTSGVRITETLALADGRIMNDGTLPALQKTIDGFLSRHA